MARDLLLGALDASGLEVVDEELVTPPTAPARVCGPGRLPVEAEAYYAQARLARCGGAP